MNELQKKLKENVVDNIIKQVPDGYMLIILKNNWGGGTKYIFTNSNVFKYNKKCETLNYNKLIYEKYEFMSSDCDHGKIDYFTNFWFKDNDGNILPEIFICNYKEEALIEVSREEVLYDFAHISENTKKIVEKVLKLHSQRILQLNELEQRSDKELMALLRDNMRIKEQEKESLFLFRTISKILQNRNYGQAF